MKPILDDVRLTAYALGEGSPAERAEIEAQLQADPARQALVDEIQAFAAKLEAELGTEPDIALTDAQRQAILGAPAQAPSRLVRFPWRKATGFAAVAAVVTLLFGGAFWASTRSLYRDLLAKLDEKGEMAVGQDGYVSLQLEPIGELAPKPPALPEAEVLLAPEEFAVELPEIVDFVASPRMELQAELDIASDAVSPVIMRNLAPGNLANRSSRGRATSTARYGGGWASDQPESFRWETAESYAPIQGNVFKRIADEPLSTFSIDVDTASYANVRRFLRAGQMPPPDAVRIEELINYFPYDYAPPKKNAPFAVHLESAACPWNPAHALVKIALKGKELAAESRPPCNLVFLIDVSGSMDTDNKLPLVKKSLQLLARQLAPQDRVSIVVYASATGLVLPSTPVRDLAAIEAALDRLQAGGSTAGGAGIRLAYDEALKNFRPEGNNRVVLCTDGDFNVGIVDADELAAFIAERAQKGIFLTVLGFGMGNYKDDRLETLADQGNGNYAYVDTFSEARKTLVEQAAGTLFTIAKDVKLQIEFNPAHFDGYRLIGYENRLLAKEDFNDDRKDAGELGAGHVVTAFYELIPAGVDSTPGVDPLKYQAPDEKPAVAEETPADASPEWLTVKLRYKLPKGTKSRKIEIPFTGEAAAFENASADFRFAAGVAAAGFMMRGDTATSGLTFGDVAAWTAAAAGADPGGYRREFIDLLQNAAALAP